MNDNNFRRRLMVSIIKEDPNIAKLIVKKVNTRYLINHKDVFPNEKDITESYNKGTIMKRIRDYVLRNKTSQKLRVYLFGHDVEYPSNTMESVILQSDDPANGNIDYIIYTIYDQFVLKKDPNTGKKIWIIDSSKAPSYTGFIYSKILNVEAVD